MLFYLNMTLYYLYMQVIKQINLIHHKVIVKVNKKSDLKSKYYDIFNLFSEHYLTELSVINKLNKNSSLQTLSLYHLMKMPICF